MNESLLRDRLQVRILSGSPSPFSGRAISLFQPECIGTSAMSVGPIAVTPCSNASG